MGPLIALYLVVDLVLNTVYIYLSYNKSFTSKWYYIPVAMIFGALIQLVWASIVKSIEDKSNIVVVGILWDSISFLSWAIIPGIIWLGIIQYDKYTILGGILIMIGMFIVSYGGMK